MDSHSHCIESKLNDSSMPLGAHGMASAGIVRDEIYITDNVPLRTIAVSAFVPETMARQNWCVCWGWLQEGQRGLSGQARCAMTCSQAHASRAQRKPP
jgi:hypothetical protein